jgi:uncharacterized protein
MKVKAVSLMTLKCVRPFQAKGKKILLMLSVIAFSFVMFFSQYVLAEPIPQKPHTNLYVFDYANLIESQDEQEIQKIAKVLDDKTKAQVVVVTVNDLSQMGIEEYALDLFRNWGIGDKEKNNGVLILVNKESLITNQRGRIRIEVGYGLEGAINDGKAGAILDNFALPAFETGEYSQGIKDTFMAVSAEVAKEYGLDLENDELSGLDNYSVSDDGGIPSDIVFAILIFIVIIILSRTKRYGRRYYRRGPFNGPFGPFGGGGFPGGGFGGFGGGGFGGGRSGGGGASR